ncbi:MAG TPA: ATP-dependent Clp protease ATP-binding subunit [Polyangiaceae bacterium]|nr:ATP-dependent Clp protease ATP-binding subunit [Polyangiaceae bacterium]
MTSARIEPELHTLKKLAEGLAERQKDRLTSAHLLGAIASQATQTALLLAERKLGLEDILRFGRNVPDDMPEAVSTLLGKAHAVAVRMGRTRASAEHLLVALLGEPRAAARRVVEQAGVDVARLRTAAMHLGQGLSGRRLPERPAAAEAPLKAVALPRRPATPVSLFKLPPPKPKAPLLEEARDESVPAAAAPAPLPSSDPEFDAVALDQRFDLDPERFPILTALGKNLTRAAARGELDPVVGRDDVIEQALDVLAKREGNNPCLVGVAGVGKTSVVRGIAQQIAARDGSTLDDRIIVQIPIGELVAGTGVRGALAARLGAIKREVALARGRVVLFFDEIHQLFMGDAAEEIASELKLALARGELPCIGATTLEEHQKAIGNDAALARRFTLVEVDEPSREDAYLVLEALRPKLEAHHVVGYETAALAMAIAWSIRYLPGRALPDKAVSILDLAGARARRRGRRAVSPDTVAEIVAELADMPVERLLESDGDRMLRLEEILAERVVGHGAPIRRIARILRRNAAGLGSRRPIGTFLLLGPTGVGKTETAKAIAEALFHCESAMTRLDLSEFSEAHAVARLIGAPPGYIGHEAGGQLTEAVRRRPYQVILLDEIEKAHPDVLTAFLGVFDEGRLTDGRGRTVDFTNAVILMTSNLGSEETGPSQRRRVGFGGGEESSDLESRITQAARSALAPELYNRIDEVMVFSPLGKDEVREIARRLLGGVARALMVQRGVRLEYGPEAVELLLDQGGYDPTLGARPMKRTIARLVEAPLAERLLRGELPRGSVALIETNGSELDFDVIDPSAEIAAVGAAE